MLFKGLFILVAKSSPLFLLLFSFYFQGAFLLKDVKICAETSAYLAKVEIKSSINIQMMKPNRYTRELN